MKTRIQILAWLAATLMLGMTLRANAQIAVASSLHEDSEVIPGSTYRGSIIVRNLSDYTRQAKVYQTDYLFKSDGINKFGEAGTAERSNAGWITVSASSMTIPPKGTVPVDYMIDVPLDVNGESLEGSYWSMIMVEAIPLESDESTINVTDSEVKLGIRQVVRYGIQIATHATGTGEGQLYPTAPTIVRNDDGTAEFQLDVENAGTRLVVPQTWVELYDENGTAMGRFDGAPGRIYPGTSLRQRYSLGKLSPGSYNALTIFDNGGESVDAAEYKVLIQ